VSARAQITVVGIGADGWPGLTEKARAAILSADEVIGSHRQLASLPSDAPPSRAWPSPITPLIDELITREAGAICVLASGDPMLHGIGATLARRIPNGRLSVISHASAFALACARMGWPEAEVQLISAVGRPSDVVARMLQPGRHLVAYSTGENGAAKVARVLCDRGYGPSAFVVLEQLGAGGESVVKSTADTFGDRPVDPLHAIAITCARAPTTTLLPLVPGLPDEAYDHDRALTKRHVRAATIAALAPTPNGLLWDIGAGSGSIAIEWLRAEATARAIAVEPREERAERINRNAEQLGVSALEVIIGTAPDVLAGLDPPDAVFIGGGVTTTGVVATSWAALAAGGRIVANAVTLEGEQALIAARAAYGGDLVRLEVSHAEPIGSFTAWRPALPVVQWSTGKR
jgi:precorrin-6B C5,15-methyltransferase / cobalt-precorrin-6B C5,C15-methyltransferase